MSDCPLCSVYRYSVPGLSYRCNISIRRQLLAQIACRIMFEDYGRDFEVIW